MARKSKTSRTSTIKRGRDAKNGRFIPLSEVKRRPATTIIQTMRKGKK